MINSLFKLTLFAAALRWLKPRYRMIAVSAILIMVVNLAHSEYIEYVTITSSFDYLEISYLVKFALWVAILAAYYFLAEVRTIVGKARSKVTSDAPGIPEQTVLPESDAGPADGFDFLRSKSKLESKADKVIAGKAVDGNSSNSTPGDLKG